jgi:type IV secretory pathway component VirB8
MAHAMCMSEKAKKSDKKKKSEESQVLKTVDMYPLKSRWDAVLFIAFIIAFLIFTVAIFLLPEAA